MQSELDASVNYARRANVCFSSTKYKIKNLKIKYAGQSNVMRNLCWRALTLKKICGLWMKIILLHNELSKGASIILGYISSRISTLFYLFTWYWYYCS